MAWWSSGARLMMLTVWCRTMGPYTSWPTCLAWWSSGARVMMATVWCRATGLYTFWPTCMALWSSGARIMMAMSGAGRRARTPPDPPAWHGGALGPGWWWQLSGGGRARTPPPRSDSLPQGSCHISSTVFFLFFSKAMQWILFYLICSSGWAPFFSLLMKGPSTWTPEGEIQRGLILKRTLKLQGPVAEQ